MHVSSIQLEPTPGGVFPEQATSRELPDGSELAAAVHDAVVQDHRRKAQMGKHSPLQRDGGYEHVRPGDVLPGFGVVKPGNLRTAQEFAKELQQKRQR
jgi:hypothetical protein